MNGAIYALLGLALVLVFVVTRVIFIPQGEFVAFGALTLAFIFDGRMPGTVPMLLILGVLVFLRELFSSWRSGQWSGLGKTAGWTLALPFVLYLLAPYVVGCRYIAVGRCAVLVGARYPDGPHALPTGVSACG